MKSLIKILNSKLLNIILVLSSLSLCLILSTTLTLSEGIISLIITSVFSVVFIKVKPNFCLELIASSTSLDLVFCSILTLRSLTQTNLYLFNELVKGIRGIEVLNPLYLNIAIFCLRLASFYSMLIFLLWVYKKLKKLIMVISKSLSRSEVILFIICSLIFSVYLIISYTNTNVFYSGVDIFGNRTATDVVFTTDTIFLLDIDVYFNINAWSNDIRQPLFGLFALPFGSLAHIISDILFFSENTYVYIIGIIQIIILVFTNLTVSKLMHLKDKESILFSIFLCVSQATIFNILNQEQYVLAYFWLIMYIYSYCELPNTDGNLLIAATGSLLPSGYLLPLLFKKKSIKESIFVLLKYLSIAIGLIFFFGQAQVILNAKEKLLYLSQFSGTSSIPFANKLNQFTYFVRSCFFYPKSFISVASVPVLRMSSVENLCIIGIIIIAFSLIGFYVTRKDNFSKICLSWIILSFIVLCLIGWGTVENGLILYSLYFCWAYAVLIYRFFQYTFKNFSKYLNIFMILFILVVFLYNINGIITVLEFGSKYYP